MTTEDIDICCVQCNVVTCASNNEWRLLGESHIIPVSRTWYKTINVAKGCPFLPLGPVPDDLHGDIISQASCAQCGHLLGQGFRVSTCIELTLDSEPIWFDKTAIHLKSSNSQKAVEPIFTQRLQWSTLRAVVSSSRDRYSREDCPTVNIPERATIQRSPQTHGARCEDPEILNRIAQQGMDIKKLSQTLESLQDRMLALEKSMIDVRTGSRASSTDGRSSGQDMFIENFESVLGAFKDAKSAERTMGDLRAENEQLKQRLRSVGGSTLSEFGDESLRTVIGTTPTVPSTAPEVPPKKKRPYTRRKPPPERTAAGMKIFASNDDQEDPSQLGSLAALKEITAAMAQVYPTNRAQSSNSEVNYESNSYIDETSANCLSDFHYALSNSDQLATSQPTKCRRTGEGMLKDGDERNGATDAVGLAPKSIHRDQLLEELRFVAGDSTVQGIGSHRSVGKHFDIAGADETMIDPALRSTSVPVNQSLLQPAVLSSIENPPDQRQTGQSAQQEKPKGTPQYDSVHEARIREYKARDALRKRKSRAISSEKKKMVGEDKFKKEEKIRARDRMVKELMEREEMLENDGDL